ncbi:MFS transporter [Legionella impletisoli]|uniref:MFS transporter n=1 Tax=Legionella impletisoli TaxID=343510 RepID=A0A917JRF5_9GAMM|nr:MFS transporter [Legionella impletisoli]GGI81746.1 MFS transporter [Legionella impletisoli]
MNRLGSVLIPYALAYLVCTIYRAINGILGPVLAVDLHLSANALGFLTAVYLLGFGIMQIPLGFILDKFGPRRVQTLLFLIATLGIFLFSIAESVWQLTVGRALIGIGMSAGLMAGFKAAASWYSIERLPLVNGIILTAGGIGALLATIPAEIVIRNFGWRSLGYSLTILTLIVGLLIYGVTRDKKAEHQTEEPFSQQLKDFKEVLKSRVFIRFAPYFILMSSFIAIQGLWAGPWLHQAIGMSTTEVALYLSDIAIAMILGLLTAGIIASWLQKLNVSIIGLLILTGSLYILLQLLIVSKVWPGSHVFWFLFGYFAQYGSLGYAYVSQSVPPHVIGRAVTALNFALFIGAFVWQYMLGAIITHWPKNELGFYPASAYQTSFYVLIACEMICLGWFIGFKTPKSSSKE